jgi:hypothetical protein
LNLRPSGYEPDELPGCSTPRSLGTANIDYTKKHASGFHSRNQHISFSTRMLLFFPVFRAF